MKILNFENEIDEKIAYVLGFIWGDGYLNPKIYSIEVKIIKDDMDKLLPIFNSVGNWKIYEQKTKWKDVTIIKIYCKELFSKFLKYDYLIKSNTSPIKILSIIPKNFKNFFLRGYFDADGYIGIRKYGVSIGITSTYEQNWDFLKDWNFKITKEISKIGHKCSRARIYNKNESQKFLDYIYDGEFFGLPRKYEKYKQLLNCRGRGIYTRSKKTSTHN